MALASSCPPSSLPTLSPSPRSLHLVCPQISFPTPRKPADTGGLSVAPSPVPNEAALRWRTRVSFFPPFIKKKGKSREALKDELLEAIAPLDRGAEATHEDRERIDQIARELEAISSVKEPLKSDLLNGKWELLYTTSNSILQTQRPKFLRPNGKIYQAINVDTLRAQNMETWPYFNQIGHLLPLSWH